MKLTGIEHPAMMNWQARWNEAEQVATLHTGIGPDHEHMVITCMGVMYIYEKDMPYLANQLRQAANMIDNFVASMAEPETEST